MSEMIDRIAKLINPSAFDPLPGHEEGKCPDCDDNRDDARQLARRLIEAMRDPTAEMLSYRTRNSMVCTSCHMCGGHIEGWHLMIDAALKDDQCSGQPE